MTATKYLARALTVTLAAGALVTSASSCGALNESGKEKDATSSSSAATPGTPAESASVFAKNGDLLRADVPELKSLCAQELEENIQKGEISSMPKEKIMEDSDPKRFTLHDNGDGTATFERDGEVSGEKLVRLDDGSLRILIEGF